MPFTIEPVSPEGTLIGVYLVIASAVHILEGVWAWFLFLHL